MVDADILFCHAGKTACLHLGSEAEERENKIINLHLILGFSSEIKVDMILISFPTLKGSVLVRPIMACLRSLPRPS